MCAAPDDVQYLHSPALARARQCRERERAYLAELRARQTARTRAHLDALRAKRAVRQAEHAAVKELEMEKKQKPRRVPQAGSASGPWGPGGTGSELQEWQAPEVEMLTQTARKHFALFRDPFADDVQGPDDVFLSPDLRYVREALYTTARHGGFLAVVGESGSGKTTLRRDLIDRLHRERQPVTCIQPRVIDKSRLNAMHICAAIVGDLSQETPKRTLEAVARQIERLLIGSSRAGNSHVLLIEEAHDLSVQTLKYLKRFWELEDGFRKLLAIVLIGQSELKAKLDERQNWEAREVIRRCEVVELRPLDRDLEAYVAQKLKRVGKALDGLLEPGAWEAIRERLTLRRRGTDQAISMIYPLTVNNVITRALNLAAEMGALTIGREIVMEV